MSFVKGRSGSSDNERRMYERVARFLARIKQKSTRVSPGGQQAEWPAASIRQRGLINAMLG